MNGAVGFPNYNLALVGALTLTQFNTGDSERKFYEALPGEFTCQQAVEIDIQFQLSPRTEDDILHNTNSMALDKLKTGLYRKL